MNSIFLSLPETQRQRAIQEAAVRRGISPVIVEKDFWVCYILSILFRCDFGKSLVFKGGTSLSKVFGGDSKGTGVVCSTFGETNPVPIDSSPETRR